MHMKKMDLMFKKMLDAEKKMNSLFGKPGHDKAVDSYQKHSRGFEDLEKKFSVLVKKKNKALAELIKAKK